MGDKNDLTMLCTVFLKTFYIPRMVVCFFPLLTGARVFRHLHLASCRRRRSRFVSTSCRTTQLLLCCRSSDHFASVGKHPARYHPHPTDVMRTSSCLPPLLSTYGSTGQAKRETPTLWTRLGLRPFSARGRGAVVATARAMIAQRFMQSLAACGSIRIPLKQLRCNYLSRRRRTSSR